MMGLFSKVVDFASSAGGGDLIGGALGAVGSLVGGRNAAAQAQSQMDMQREFAQNGIRWKVADAKAAGIHPLAALGAQTFSYNPVITGDTGVGEALAKMGQGVSRAAEAKQLAAERNLNNQLTLANIEKVRAETDFTRQQAENSKLAVAKTAAPPPMPVVNATDQNVNKPFNKFVWARNPDGKLELFPSDEYVQAFEDKPFGFDLFPNIESGLRSLYGKLTNSPIDGRRFSWSDLDWISVPKSVPKRSERRKVDYYSNSFRYR